MHIAIVRRNYSLKKAGAERYCVNLSRQLKKLGHQITIIGEQIDPELRDEVGFVPVQVNRWTSWTKNRSFSANAAHLAADPRYDIVHALSRTPGVDTFRVTDPMQAHWLEVFYRNPVWRQVQKWNPRHRAILDIERQVYNSPRIRRFIVQSQLDARLLQKYYNVPTEKIRRVQNGVDTQTFHPGVRAQSQEVRASLGITPEQPVLVFASMDFRRKGLGSLFQAMTRCQTRDLRLLVLGDGAQNVYSRLAQQLGIGQQVLFLGRQSAMWQYYGAGDLFVLPTIYEPFPNVNLEAMACGLPVLTSATAGGADIIREGENGYLVEHPYAIQQLADAIDGHLALSHSQREAMRHTCVATAQGMTVEQNARATLAVFEEVLRDKHRV